jgi:hypothetical protein
MGFLERSSTIRYSPFLRGSHKINNSKQSCRYSISILCTSGSCANGLLIKTELFVTPGHYFNVFKVITVCESLHDSLRRTNTPREQVLKITLPLTFPNSAKIRSPRNIKTIKKNAILMS